MPNEGLPIRSMPDLDFGSETMCLLREVIDEKAMKNEVMIVGLGLLMALPVVAQEMFFYPTQGQTPEQQSQDRAECQVWAQQQTGVDPTRPAPQVAAAPAQQGQIVRGAARGGLLGVVGGAIGGDVGKGAAIGAGVGATKGLLDRRRNRIDAEQARPRLPGAFAERSLHDQQRQGERVVVPTSSRSLMGGAPEG